MKKNKRPFAFTINAAELFSVVNKTPVKQRGAFLTQLATDLVTLEPVTEYGKKLVSETLEKIEKQSQYGKLGGAPKHRHPIGTLKAPLSETIGNPKAPISQKNKDKDNNKTFVPPSVEKVTEHFEEFWKSIHPRAKRCGKDAARIAWNKHVKGDELEIIKAAVVHSSSEDWVKENGKYVPMATTWINQHRWTAELAPPRKMKTIMGPDGMEAEVPDDDY